jgi:hypothetical protein
MDGPAISKITMKIVDRLSTRWRAGWIVLFAALPRLIYLLAARPSSSGFYWALSDGLLRNGSLAIDGHKTTEFEPLYPIFLAVSRVLVADQAFFVQLLQIGVAVIGAVCLYRLTTALTGRPRVAAIATALYALDPLLVREAVVHNESALLTTLLVAFAGAFVSATTAFGAGLAGMWLGLAVLTRTAALPMLALGPAVLVAKARYRAALAMLAASLFVVLPLPIRNHIVNGSLWPTRSGLNLFIGNSTYTSALLPDQDLDILQEQATSLVNARLPGAGDLPLQSAERAVDRLLTREALAYIAAHPLQTLRQKALNVLYYFSPRLVPYRIATEDTRIATGPTGQITVEHTVARPFFEVIGYAAFSSFVLVCALAGVYLRRRRLRADAILGCIALTFVAVNAMYVPATRYRAPMEFVLLFYAAAALAPAAASSRPRSEESFRPANSQEAESMEHRAHSA